MAKYQNVLNNIKKVEVIEARHLSGVYVINGVGVVLNYWRNFTEVPITGLAEVEMSTQIENKIRLITTKLTFHTPGHFEVWDCEVCFRVTTLNGAQWLIGTNCPPYCVVNSVELFPSNVGDRSGCTVAVEYKNVHGMLAILDKQVFL